MSAVSRTSKIVCVRIVNGQILNNTGYTFYEERLNIRRKRQKNGRSYLKLMPKFLLNPRRDRRCRPTGRQEQEILEIYDLRESGKLLA